MAKGESRWSPKDRKVETFEFRIAPTADYTLKSKAKFMIKCKEETGSIPYVGGMVELLGTEEEGKNIQMFKAFYLTITPKKEDGKPAVDLSGGLTELCQMLNVDVPEEVMADIKTTTTEEDKSVEHLNAKLVKDWLNSLGEFTVRAHVKKIPAKAGWPTKNEIGHFIMDPEINKVG